MRTIIAGSRCFKDYEVLCEALKTITQPTTVLCGMAEGADMLGLRWAKENGVPFECYPAQWRRYGIQAGFIRNDQMARRASQLMAFWDNKSRGTKNMIKVAKNMGLIVIVWDIQ